MYQLLEGLKRQPVVVNLDPANEHMQYPCKVNIMELVTLQGVMEKEGLGPNGALVRCMEVLEANVQWLVQRLAPLKDNYLLFDLPGQVELFTHHQALRTVLAALDPLNMRLAAVHLVDSHHCADPAKYVSVLLLSLSVSVSRGCTSARAAAWRAGADSGCKIMCHLELPHINVLSKVDLIEKQGPLHFGIEFYTEVGSLDVLLELLERDPLQKRFAALNRAICGVVEDYAMVSGCRARRRGARARSWLMRGPPQR